MNLRILVTILFILFASKAYEQTQDSIEPSFNYHRDFKSILDSTQDRNSSLYYQKLIIRFLDNDSTLTKAETLALMIGYTENPHYKPLEDLEKELEIFDHNNNNEFRDAVDKAKPYLQTHPLSLLVLREISYAYSRISKAYQKDMLFEKAVMCQDSSAYFMALNDKIMEAMIYSGKGRSAETPIFSLGLSDGEYFIPNVGYKIEKKDTEWNKNKDFVEIITAIDNLTTKNFYFVIQHAKQKIDDDKADELENKKPKKPVKKIGKEEKHTKPVTEPKPEPISEPTPVAPVQ